MADIVRGQSIAVFSFIFEQFVYDTTLLPHLNDSQCSTPRNVTLGKSNTSPEQLICSPLT